MNHARKDGSSLSFTGKIRNFNNNYTYANYVVGKAGVVFAAILVHRENPDKDIAVRLDTRPRTTTRLNSNLLPSAVSGLNYESTALCEIMMLKVESFAGEAPLGFNRAAFKLRFRFY